MTGQRDLSLLEKVARLEKLSVPFERHMLIFYWVTTRLEVCIDDMIQRPEPEPGPACRYHYGKAKALP